MVETLNQEQFELARSAGRANFRGVNLENLTLQFGRLEHCDFRNVKMRDCKLYSTDLVHCDFRNAKITNCDFTNLSAATSSFSSVTLDDCTLSSFHARGSDLRDITFKRSKIEYSIFDRAGLDCSTFEQCHIFNTGFVQANLFMSHFKNSELKYTHFSQADLTAVKFAETSLRSTNVDNATGIKIFKAEHPEGYRAFAYPTGIKTEDWRICAGCRGPWTVEQALAHWGYSDYRGSKRFAAQLCREIGEWWRDITRTQYEFPGDTI